MQYKVLVRWGDLHNTVEHLERDVEKALSEGWKLNGGVSITQNTYSVVVAQAMIK